MTIQLLGTGSREGIPSPFCGCSVCKLATDKNNPNHRTRPSLFCSSTQGEFLIELSPDITSQLNAFDIPLVKDVLITHWHFDHLYGLMELDAYIALALKGDFTIYCSEGTHAWIKDKFNHIHLKIVELAPYESIDLYGFKITPLPVYHISRQDESVPEDRLNNAFAFMIEENGKKITYMGDYYRIPEKTMQYLQQSDIVIMDGTYLFEDHFPNEFYYDELKKDKDHLHDKAIWDLQKRIGAQKTYFHSIGHCHRMNHDELSKKMPEGIYIPKDGEIIR